MANSISKNNSKLLFKIGVALLIIACLLWVGIAVVPFLPLSDLTKASTMGVLLIAGEIAFWLGAILTGKEFVAKYKKYLNPKNWKKDLTK